MNLNIRKLKNEFKEEIYKEDLIKVITTGLLHTVIFAILGGFINIGLVILFNFQTSLIVYLLGVMIARAIKESYINRHILYPLLAVVFLILGIFVFNIVSVFAYNRTFELSIFIECIKIGSVQTLNIFNPFYYISNFNINELLYLVIVLFTIFNTYRNSKNNYY